MLYALSRPPFLILSYLFQWLLFLIEPFFIFFMCRPARLWNTLAYCRIFMTIWLLTINTITSYVKPHRHYGKVRLRWCRTPHSYHIQCCGSSLHMQCVRRLHRGFKAQALRKTTPVIKRIFNTTPSTQTPLPIQLDSDTHTFIVDNGCSASITNLWMTSYLHCGE
jgi:hypothetical protein